MDQMNQNAEQGRAQQAKNAAAPENAPEKAPSQVNTALIKVGRYAGQAAVTSVEVGGLSLIAGVGFFGGGVIVYNLVKMTSLKTPWG